MTTEAEARIREALAAGPTPGPWTVMPANAGEQCVARINAWEAVPPNGVELSHDSLDAAFIAACNPENIAALLAEIDRLTRERDEARAEQARLHDLLSRKVVDSTVISELSLRNGSLNARFEGGACAILADAFADQIFEVGAENYVEVSFTSAKRPEVGQIVVTVQRVDGKTPHQLLAEVDAERDALAKALLECDAVARARGDKYGLCDCIDNGGSPYPSQWLADLLAQAKDAEARG